MEPGMMRYDELVYVYNCGILPPKAVYVGVTMNIMGDGEEKIPINGDNAEQLIISIRNHNFLCAPKRAGWPNKLCSLCSAPGM